MALTFAVYPAFGQESANGIEFDPQGWLRNALQWIDSLGAVGAIAFILLYIIATVAFLPGSILTLGAGVVFGLVLGSFYVFIGATLGATAAFLVGRYLARGWVAKKIEGNQKFRAIDRAVGREGFKIVLLTRLSPIFPFNLLNYAYGLTGVSLRDYFIASVGMIPGTIMYVYLGSLAGSLAAVGTEAQPDSIDASLCKPVKHPPNGYHQGGANLDKRAGKAKHRGQGPERLHRRILVYRLPATWRASLPEANCLRVQHHRGHPQVKDQGVSKALTFHSFFSHLGYSTTHQCYC